MKDYYLILGIEPNAVGEDIKKAYRQMSLKYHPDKNQGDKYFEERFKDINEAYEILSDNEKRKTFDYQRLSYYKTSKDSKSSSSGQQSAGNESFKRKEQELIQRERQIQQQEESLKARDLELQKKADILNKANTLSNSTNEKRKYIFLSIILVCFAVTMFSFIKARGIMDKIYGADIIKLRADNQALKSTNWDLKAKVDTLKDQQALPVLKKKKATPTYVVKELPVYVKEKETTPVQKTKAVMKDFKTFAHRLLTKNHDYIEFRNIEWDDFDPQYEKIAIRTISIFNKTEKSVCCIILSYELNDPKGVQIDSGEVKVGADWDSIEPSKAKTLNVGYGLPSKTANQILILSVKEFGYAAR